MKPPSQWEGQLLTTYLQQDLVSLRKELLNWLRKMPMAPALDFPLQVPLPVPGSSLCTKCLEFFSQSLLQEGRQGGLVC